MNVTLDPDGGISVLDPLIFIENPQPSINYQASQTVFTCDDLGFNSVTVYGFDSISMEADSCTVTVFIESKSLIDPCAPFSITCVDSLNVTLDPDGGISVLDPIIFIENPQPSINYQASQTVFTCDDLGFNSVTVYGFDTISMEADSCMVTVFIESKSLIDPCAPFSITCVDSLNVTLDPDGGISVLDPIIFIENPQPSINYQASQTVFTCDDLGFNSVTVYGFDTISMEADSCLVTVFIESKSLIDPCDVPTITCLDSVTVTLKKNGKISVKVDIFVADYSPSSTYNIDQDQFTCDDIGQVNVTLTIIDKKTGLSNQCVSVLTILPPTSGNKCGNNRENQISNRNMVVTSSKFSIYPNPFTNEIQIKIEESNEIQEVKILDLQGRTVYAQKGITNKSINLHQLQAGIYIVRILCANESVSTRKLIKME